ncbi:MAG: hypothetical protein HC811_12825 [Flammeovirgaceae bacterium]|nr:hypothetical protein [Flammeovirgaceae bacterium]
MKDKLKDFIDQNRSQLDHRQPSDGLWIKIEAALWPAQSRSLWHSVNIWRAAAIFLFGVSSFLFIDRMNLEADASQTGIQNEYADLEVFYKDQISQKRALLASFDETHRFENELTDDFVKLEAMHQVLTEQMQREPSEKLRDALILNFLVRINLLNQQLNQLELMSKPNKEPTSI